MALLYVDLLGMKAQWRDGGVPAARRRYGEFGDLVAQALHTLPAGAAVGGGVQSDAAALTFEKTIDAVSVGRTLFRAAFRRGDSRSRTWIRGAICPHDWPASAELEKTRQLPGAPPGVFERHFKTPLLEAINLEQAGFKGHRLLIAKSLLTPGIAAEMAVPVGGREYDIFRRLDHSDYPPALDDYVDVLWMVRSDSEAWGTSLLRMLNLLRWSSHGGDQELVHAAATHLVFAQADSIRFGLLDALAWPPNGRPDVEALWTRLAELIALIPDRDASASSSTPVRG